MKDFNQIYIYEQDEVTLVLTNISVKQLVFKCDKTMSSLCVNEPTQLYC